MTNENYLLEEKYGIFEEDGQLFIESEMVEYVMDEYDLYEEDAIEVIMEAYEEELEDLLEAVNILVEDYGFDEEDAIDMINESYEDDLLMNEEISRGKAIGGAALATGTAALATHIYRNSKAPVHYRRHKLRRANEKLQHRKDVRNYMDTVEQTRRRIDGAGKTADGKELNNYQIAKSIADSNKKANRKIYRAERGVSRAERKLANASARYDRVLDKRQQRKEKLKQSYADYKQARRDRKNPPQPEPKRLFDLRRKKQNAVPVKKSKRKC